MTLLELYKAGFFDNQCTPRTLTLPTAAFQMGTGTVPPILHLASRIVGGVSSVGGTHIVESLKWKSSIFYVQLHETMRATKATSNVDVRLHGICILKRTQRQRLSNTVLHREYPSIQRTVSNTSDKVYVWESVRHWFHILDALHTTWSPNWAQKELQLLNKPPCKFVIKHAETNGVSSVYCAGAFCRGKRSKAKRYVFTSTAIYLIVFSVAHTTSEVIRNRVYQVFVSSLLVALFTMFIVLVLVTYFALRRQQNYLLRNRAMASNNSSR